MGSSKATGLQKLLVVLEGEPLEEILAQPSLGTSQPGEVGRVVTHLLDEFHFLIYEVVLQESTDVGVSEKKTLKHYFSSYSLYTNKGNLVHKLLSFSGTGDKYSLRENKI